MPELARIPLDGGGYVVAEVDRVDLVGSDVVLASPGPGRTLTEVQAKLGEALRSVRPAVSELVDALKGAGPDSIGVEFGIKIGGETGVIIAKGTAEVNFKVRLEWKPPTGEQAVTRS